MTHSDMLNAVQDAEWGRKWSPIRSCLTVHRGPRRIWSKVYNRVPGVKKIDTKAQRFRYRSLGSKRNQNVLMCSSNFFSKSETFLFIPKILEQNQNFWMFFLAKAKSFYLFKNCWNKTKTF
jgi:hypothetical protein